MPHISLCITKKTKTNVSIILLRDRPFNLQGGGGYGFFFVQNFFLRQHKSSNILFFMSCKAQFFFPEFNIRLYDKN